MLEFGNEQANEMFQEKKRSQTLKKLFKMFTKYLHNNFNFLFPLLALSLKFLENFPKQENAKNLVTCNFVRLRQNFGNSLKKSEIFHGIPKNNTDLWGNFTDIARK